MLARRALVVGLAALALAGCGEDREGGLEDSGTGTTATGAAETSPGATSAARAKRSGLVVATVKVRETEFELDPQDPRIPEAGLVRFDVANAGRTRHALEVEGRGGEVETETIEPGGKATLKADLSKAGSYVWYCPVDDHEQRGMKGRITVAGEGSGTTNGDSGDEGREGAAEGGGSDGHGGY